MTIDLDASQRTSYLGPDWFDERKKKFQIRAVAKYEKRAKINLTITTQMI